MPLGYDILKVAGKVMFILAVSYLGASLLLTQRCWWAFFFLAGAALWSDCDASRRSTHIFRRKAQRNNGEGVGCCCMVHIKGLCICVCVVYSIEFGPLEHANDTAATM